MRMTETVKQLVIINVIFFIASIDFNIMSIAFSHFFI